MAGLGPGVVGVGVRRSWIYIEGLYSCSWEEGRRKGERETFQPCLPCPALFCLGAWGTVAWLGQREQLPRMEGVYMRVYMRLEG